MSYSQLNRSSLHSDSPLQSRFSGVKGVTSFIIGITMMSLFLIALPFLLVIATVTLLLLNLFARTYLKQQLDRFKQHPKFKTHRFHYAHQDPNIVNDSQPQKGKGRTFEHDPQEPIS